MNHSKEQEKKKQRKIKRVIKIGRLIEKGYKAWEVIDTIKDLFL